MELSFEPWILFFIISKHAKKYQVTLLHTNNELTKTIKM